MSAVTLLDSQLAYCRAARRLRSRCGDRPAQLYRSLSRLSKQADDSQASPARETTAATDRIEFPSVGDAGKSLELTPAAMAFVPVIRQSFDGSTLRYSERQQLIAQGERLGISRFHANLLIALVQHELQRRAGAGPATPSAVKRNSPIIPTRLATLALLLAAECAGVLAMWNHFQH